MTSSRREKALETAGLLHPRPKLVTSSLFDGHDSFFLATDKVQVKYEMLRARLVEGQTARAAAEVHGYSRAAYYLIAAAFEDRGMLGLLDEPRGRRGPVKLNAKILSFIAEADPELSGALVANAVEQRFGISLHRRTVERARRR